MIGAQVLRMFITLSIAVSTVTSDTSNTSSFLASQTDLGPAGFCRLKHIGSGVNPSDIPLFGCADRERNCPAGQPLPCEIVTRDGSRCNLTFNTLPYWMHEVHQLPEGRVLVLVRPPGIRTDHVTLVDMRSCTRIYDIPLVGEVRRVIPYADGSFDVSFIEFFYNANKRKILYDRVHLEQFDALGQRVNNNSLNVSFDWSPTKILSVSSKSRDKGFLVDVPAVQGCFARIILIEEGSKAREILRLNCSYGDVSQVDDERYYVTCGKVFITRAIECAKFDLRSNETFRASWIQQITLLKVKATELGIVAMGHRRSTSNLVVVDMRSNEAPVVREYEWSDNGWTKLSNCQFESYDTATRRFVLVCISTSPRLTNAMELYLLIKSDTLKEVSLKNPVD